MTSTLADLDGDCTLLTVNNRLALELRTRYDREQANDGRTVWPSADILPWSAWLRRQYDHLLDHGVTERDLLSSTQERLLWEDIIRHDPGATDLLQPSAAAQAAREAFALCIDWGLDERQIALAGGDDTHTFLGWRKAFIRQLEHNRLISAPELTDLVTEAITDGQTRLPARLLHSGFDTLSPSQRRLLDALADAGCAVSEYRSDTRAAHCLRVVADDTEQEIRLAALWARDLVRQDPTRRIAIVSPHIRQQRRNLQRIFTETLAPTTYLGGGGDQSMFDISLGEPLSAHALVADGLAALRLLTGSMPLAEAGRLLRSPFVGGHTLEWEARALLDAALREDGLPRTDLDRLIRQMNRFVPQDSRHCPDLLGRLQTLRTMRQALPGSASPGDWVGHLQTALTTLGWPGEHGLNSQEYQQHQRLQRVFSEFAQLAKVRTRLRLGEAIGQLTTLAGETVFQAKHVATPVQILGGLEAAGMDFDQIWLLGMDDQTWPPAPQPNPLLPIRLQREIGTPHASAERELAFASRLTERLTNSAGTVIASYAQQAGEREQRPSPLIDTWPLIDPATLPNADDTDLRAASRRTDDWQIMPEISRPATSGELTGGAGLLAAQANCPFAAMARFRLHARPLAEPTHAPDSAINGTLIHALLQQVWQQLRDAQTLAGHDENALAALIQPLADATLADIGRRRPDLYTPRFRAIEATRLTRLIIAWLACERERRQTFEVIALEQDRLIETGGLRLKTRADRVDRLADGSLAVIDYKTGQSVRDDGWFDDRLTEPQLPLYCLHEPGEVSATLLARVRRDGPGCTLVGLSRDEDFAPGVTPPESRYDGTDWPTLLAHWRQAIEQLADEIREGRADPTPSPQACRYCPLGALCRVQEMLSEDEHG